MKKYWYLIGAIALAIILRVCIPWGDIFSNGHINFSGPDSYYQMSIIRYVFDGTLAINVPTLYAQFIIGLSWLLSFGNPSFAFVEQVAVFVPVLFAVGTVILVYLIGRALHSHMAGCIGAFIVAVLPGEYLGRSWLGSVDYHAAEVFLTTGAVFFLIKVALSKRILHWANIIYIGFAAGFLLSYYKIWQGAIGFIPIVIMFVLYVFIEHRGKHKWLVPSVIIVGLPVLAIFAWQVSGRAFNFSGMVAAGTSEALPGGGDTIILIHILVAGYLGWLYWKAKCTLRWAMICWVGVMILATLWQRRFDYYMIIPLSLLSGWVLAKMHKDIQKEKSDGK